MPFRPSYIDIAHITHIQYIMYRYKVHLFWGKEYCGIQMYFELSINQWVTLYVKSPTSFNSGYCFKLQFNAIPGCTTRGPTYIPHVKICTRQIIFVNNRTPVWLPLPYYHFCTIFVPVLNYSELTSCIEISPHCQTFKIAWKQKMRFYQDIGSPTRQHNLKHYSNSTIFPVLL